MLRTERPESDYSRNRIGRSRYENGKSSMNIFQIFLRTTNKEMGMASEPVYRQAVYRNCPQDRIPAQK